MITGKTYSPSIYRRLLSAYAPERKPSTTTLAIEKERFVKELEFSPRAMSAGPDPSHDERAGSLVAEIRQVLEDVLDGRTQHRTSSVDQYLQAQCDFLQQRLSDSQKLLAEAKDFLRRRRSVIVNRSTASVLPVPP
jgi:DNA-binding LytR/AlgR family response regulator